MARLGSGREDGPVVRFEEREVVRYVLRMIGSRRTCNAKFGRDKRGGQFSGDFFGDVGGIAKAFAKFAVETVLGPAPMAVMPISA